MNSNCCLVIPTLLCLSSNYTEISSSPISLCTRIFVDMGMSSTPIHITEQFSLRSCYLPEASPQTTINKRLKNSPVFQCPGVFLSSSAHFSRPPTYLSYFPPQTFILQHVATGPSLCLCNFSLQPIHNP